MEAPFIYRRSKEGINEANMNNPNVNGAGLDQTSVNIDDLKVIRKLE